MLPSGALAPPALRRPSGTTAGSRIVNHMTCVDTCTMLGAGQILAYAIAAALPSRPHSGLTAASSATDLPPGREVAADHTTKKGIKHGGREMKCCVTPWVTTMIVATGACDT